MSAWAGHFKKQASPIRPLGSNGSSSRHATVLRVDPHPQPVRRTKIRLGRWTTTTDLPEARVNRNRPANFLSA